jgi:hypothetical protein
MIIANNLIKMASGQAAYKDPLSTVATYFAEGNKYDAPAGLGNIAATGFTAVSLVFQARQNGLLTAPTLAQDAAVNTNNYAALLNVTDAQGQTRTGVYDIGADELNGTGAVLTYPLDATLVGAGTPPFVILPLHLISFNASLLQNETLLQWQVENEINFKQYELEYSTDGINFKTIAIIEAKNKSTYDYKYQQTIVQKEYYRIKMVDNDDTYSYSKIISLNAKGKPSVSVYPNPAKEFIMVDINGMIAETTALVIYNASGQAVKTIPAAKKTNKIPIQHLSKGLYHLQITQKNGETGFYPFLIQ